MATKRHRVLLAAQERSAAKLGMSIKIRARTTAS